LLLKHIDFEIRDLDKDDEACFKKDVDNWNFSIPVAYSNRTYRCNGTYLLGGYFWSYQPSQINQWFEREYFDLPLHTTIYFTINFWAIDTWDHILDNPSSQDGIELKFDSRPPIYLFGLQVTKYWDFIPTICGNKRLDGADIKDIFIFGSVPHSNSSLNFKIISKMNSGTSDESFGVRDISFLFSHSSNSAPICGRVPVQSYNLSNCTCEKGYYNSSFSIDSCSQCHPHCDSCFGGTEYDCYECKKGHYYDGNACQKCHATCSRCSGPMKNQCEDCYAEDTLFENACISANRCIIPFTSPPGCLSSCISPCDPLKKDLWSENCFPPCQNGHISDLTAHCYCKFIYLSLV